MTDADLKKMSAELGSVVRDLGELLHPGQTLKQAQAKALSALMSEARVRGWDYYTPSRGWAGDILAGLLTDLNAS